MQLFHHTLRFTWISLFAFLILLAFAITLLRIWILPRIDQSRHYWEQQLSQELGAPLHIHQLSARLNGITPELRLIGISVGSPGNETRLFDEVQVAIDVPASIITATISPSLIRILGAHLEIQRTASGDFRIIGLGETRGNSDLTFGDGRFELLHSDITFHNLFQNAPTMLLQDVSLRLDNQGQNHRLQVFFFPPGQDTGKAHLDANFAGYLTHPASWRGKFYLDLQKIRIPPIQQFIQKTVLHDRTGHEWLPSIIEHFACHQGQGSLRLWGNWKEAFDITQLQGYLQLHDLSLGNRSQPITLAEIQTWFRWRSSGKKSSLELADFIINPESNNNAAHFSLAIDYSNTGQSFTVAARKLDLDSLKALLQLAASIPEPSPLTRLRGFNLSGAVHNLSLAWAQHQNLPHQLSACGQLFRLGFASPNKSWPQVKNASAYLCGNLRKGRLYLQTHQGQVALPALLKKPISLSKAVGSIAWQQNEHGWYFQTPHLRMTNQDLDATVKLQLLWDKQAPFEPTLEGMAIISTLDLNPIKNYLPKQVPTDLAAWFKRSPLRGHASGKVLIRGNLSQFPFWSHNGVSEALLTTRDLTIDFLPDWPAVTEAIGGLSFFNGRLAIQIEQSKFAGAKIEELQGEIKAVGLSPTLDIQGTTTNRIGEALRVLQHSPLKPSVDTLLKWCDLHGSARLRLFLTIPLNNKTTFHLNGQTTIKNAQMALKPYPLKLKKLSGNLNFTEKKLISSLQGQFSGQPAKLMIATEATKTHAQLDTRVESTWLAHHFSPKATEISQGSTAITATLNIDHNLSIPPRLILRSDLMGMQIKLPQPLAKSKDEPRALLLTSWLDTSAPHPLNLDYGDIHASFMLDENLVPFSARIGIQQPPPNPPNNTQGYTIAGHLQRLSLDEWQPFLTLLAPDKKGQVPFFSISLAIDHLWQWQRDWGQVLFHTVSRDGLWQGNLETSFTKGKWSYFSKQNTFTGQFDSLNLKPLLSLSALRPGEKLSFSLNNLPKLNLYFQHLLWEKQNFGPVNLQALANKDSVDFSLDTDTNTHQIHVNGIWSTLPVLPETRLQGRFRCKNLGKFLEQIGHASPVAETPAKIDFSLKWPGAPYQFSLNSLDGNVELKLGRGRLLDVEPGAGRLLGILYLGTLQRRLRLDFSDLFKSGLSYDRITGTMTIADGHVVTDNLLIESVPARIFVAGDVDLNQKEVNEFITVIPNTPLTLGLFKYRQNSGIGKAAGLAQKTFNAPLDTLTQSQYAISGTWDDPVITRIRRSIPGTLLHGLWKGLTDITGSKRKNE